MAANVPSDNIFVGDLPVGISQEEIQNIFSAYGTVVQCRVVEPKTAGQKPCGLVRFQSVEEATWVVENLNGNIAETMTEPIVVRFANNPKGAKGGGKGAGTPAAQPWVQSWTSGAAAGAAWPAAGKGAPRDNPPSDNVFIGDLPEGLSDEDLSTLFSAYGTVVQCRMLPSKNPGFKASGLVRFQNVEEAQWVVENLNHNIAEGMTEPIQVRFANAKGDSKGGALGKGAAFRSAPYAGGAKGGMLALGAGGKSAGKNGFSYGKAGAGKGKGAGGAASMREFVKALRNSGIQGKDRVPMENQVFVGNLPPDCTDLDLFRIFAPFGAIAPSGATAMLHEDGTCKGFGFVDYADAATAQIACQTLENFALPSGAQLNVSIKKARVDKAEKGAKGEGK